MYYGLQGRVLYITGGGSGIGRAIALEAARGGALVAVADAVAERAESVAGALNYYLPKRRIEARGYGPSKPVDPGTLTRMLADPAAFVTIVKGEG